MNLHSEIMNIECGQTKGRIAVQTQNGQAYKLGHRDARHAAAELSLKADARIEELEEALRGLLNEAHTATKPLHSHSEWSIKAQKVLEKK